MAASRLAPVRSAPLRLALLKLARRRSVRNGGMSLRQIAVELMKRGVQTMRGGHWTELLRLEAC